MLRKAESAVLKTPSILLIPPLILLLILLLIPLLMLLLIPLLMLLLRERANPCALMIGAWPAALLGGGLAGSGSGLAGVVVAGGRLATSWRGLALFIGCIAAPCLSPVLQVGRWL